MGDAMDPLANPIWESLSSHQSHYAEISGDARRFPPEVTLLAGFPEPTPENFASLMKLQADGSPCALFLDWVIEPPPGWRVYMTGSLFQMVAVKEPPLPELPEGFVELGDADVPEMVALATLTKPGPFATRTRELGYFVGARREGRLAAMAGERMRVGKFVEVSAVCTHLDFLGRGLAGSLMSVVMRRMRARGETPFLHVLQQNTRAVDLYKRLGFEVSRQFELLVILPLRD